MQKLIVLCLILLGCSLYAENITNLWSGREIVLPGNGAWTLSAGHGRSLASGSGGIRFEVAALEPGTTLDAVLTLGESKRKVRFYSPELLYGTAYTLNDAPHKIVQTMHQMGAGVLTEPAEIRPSIPSIAGGFPEKTTCKMTLCFMEKQDFPLTIGKKWDRISGVRTKNPGAMSVSYSEDEQIIDNSGCLTYIMLQHDNRTFVIFSPEFDLDLIDNALLIKQLTEEKQK